MRATLTLASSFLRATLREGDTFFWYWVFPLLLLALMTSIFGRVEKGELTLTVGVVNLDRGPLGKELQRLAESLDALRVVPLSAAEEERGKKEVAEGRLYAVLVIPEDFSARFFAGEGKGSIPVEIFYRRGEAGSSTAASILAELVEEFGRTMLAEAGLLKETVPVAIQKVGAEVRTVQYVDFVLPGIILMALFVTGIFSVPAALLRNKELGIMKRYFATPLSGEQYLAGFALGMFCINAVQILNLTLLGRFAFGANLPFLRAASLAFLFLAFSACMSLGFLISAFSRSYRTAVALANLLNLPMQFLGGLYFPLTILPKPLQIVMAVNPLTHLAAGWREVLGISVSPFPLWLNFLVPTLWLSLSIALAAKRIRFMEG